MDINYSIKKKLSSEHKSAFISEYEPLYFESNIKIADIPKLNTTERKVEKFIEEKLLNGVVDEYVVVWKTGRLLATDIESDEFLLKDGYVNGYGKMINKNELDHYLSNLKSNEIQNIISSSEILNRGILEKCYDLAKENVPTNFGSVYLINILYFLSKGKVPIYDRYAHIAVKALYFGAAPSNVYVGDAPAKNDTHKVINMLSEYMWFLNELFGTYSIERPLDRSLWVYGHIQNSFDYNHVKKLKNNCN